MKLTDFMDIKLLQKMLDNFSNATGLAAIAVDNDGKYMTDGSNLTDFCMKYTRGCSEGSKRCKKCDQEGRGTYECHAGLMNFTFDIVLNEEKLGSVIGGQVLPNPPDEEKYTSIAEELGIDPRTYVTAVKKVSVRPQKSIYAAFEFLEDIVNRVVRQEYMNVTEYKKLDVWEKEINNATETVHEIIQSTKELETISARQSIMALNASIETARVGSVGAGFGIIAKQIGEFSKQSSDIYKHITESANKIADSIDKMNNVNL